VAVSDTLLTAPLLGQTEYCCDSVSTDLAYKSKGLGLAFVGGAAIPGHLEESIFGEHDTIVRLSDGRAHRATYRLSVQVSM
jgi:hypothetical protein